jgi:hemerythrin
MRLMLSGCPIAGGRHDLALLRWGKKYSVGVKAMDRQHAGMVRMLNELHAAMMKGKGRAVNRALLRGLAAYTRDHFSVEEALMETSRFIGLAAHRAEHCELTEKVNEFSVRLEAGDRDVNIELLWFIRNWISHHILKEDRKYGPWLNEHGIR